MEETARNRTTRLPADRAFVVQLARAAEGENPLRGRAEHLASGSAGHFDSLTGLGEFIARVLGLPVAGDRDAELRDFEPIRDGRETRHGGDE